MTKREVELSKALAYAIFLLERTNASTLLADIDYLKDKLAGRKYEANVCPHCGMINPGPEHLNHAPSICKEN